MRALYIPPLLAFLLLILTSSVAAAANYRCLKCRTEAANSTCPQDNHDGNGALRAISAFDCLCVPDSTYISGLTACFQDPKTAESCAEIDESREYEEDWYNDTCSRWRVGESMQWKPWTAVSTSTLTMRGELTTVTFYPHTPTSGSQWKPSNTIESHAHRESETAGPESTGYGNGDSGRGRKAGVIVGAVIGIILAAMLGMALFAERRRRIKQRAREKVEEEDTGRSDGVVAKGTAEGSSGGKQAGSKLLPPLGPAAELGPIKTTRYKLPG